MSNVNKPVQPPLSNSGPDPAVIMTGATLDPLMQQYLQTQIEFMKKQSGKIEKEELVQKTAADRRIKMMLQNATEQDKIRQARLQHQEYCRHRTEDERLPIVGGQRLGGGKYTFRCQFCMKRMTDEDFRKNPSLRPDPMKVGGPAF